MAQNEINIIVTAKDMATKVFKSMGTAAAGLKESLFSMQGALATIGVGAVAKGMLDTAATFENLDLSLTTITGSSEKAKEAMSWISEFTATTPYELEEVANAFKKLSSYGLDPTKYLKPLGDTAAAMGKTLNDAVEMFADATTGEFERLKEFGMRAKVEGDKVTFSWMQNGQQMTKVVEKTGEALSNFLGENFQSRFGGGMALLSQGWAGMWSNLKDQITLFEKAVMESGVFDYMKERLSEILATLTRMTQDGSLKALANDIGQGIVGAMKKFETALKSAKEVYDSIPDGLGWLLFGAGWGAKTGFAAALGSGAGAGGAMAAAGTGAATIGGIAAAFVALKHVVSETTDALDIWKRSFASDDISIWDKLFSGAEELESKLDQLDAARIAKEQNKISQMEALDTQRTQNLTAKYKSYIDGQAATEAATASQLKAIQTDLAAFRAVKWDEITKNIKAKLKELEADEKKYADQVKALQEKRAQASLSTEEKVRAMLRTTMSDYDAYQDQLKQANESMAKARLALSGGDGALAETWAKKAQEQFADLNTEVKNGEQTMVTAAAANAIAVTGVLDAGKALEQGILIQEQAAEANRKTLAEQIGQAKTDLQSIKEMQDAVSALEMQVSANDEATPVLEHIQSEIAKIKDKTVTITTIHRTIEANAGGGPVPGFATGGRLPGYSLKDNMMAMIRGRAPIALAGGEFVTNAYSTRMISSLMPGLMEGLNRVRSGADLQRLVAGLSGLASGGRVSESYRFTFAHGGQESTITTQDRSEADGLKALARAMSKSKLVYGA